MNTNDIRNLLIFIFWVVPIIVLLLKSPLVEKAINRWRVPSLTLAGSLLVFILVPYLHRQTTSNDPSVWLSALMGPFAGTSFEPGILAVWVCVVISLSIFVAVLWCWFYLPRDPHTWHGRNFDQVSKQILAYYVGRLPGGLSYAILAKVVRPLPSGSNEPATLEIIARAAKRRDIEESLKRLGMGSVKAEEEMQRWDAAAARSVTTRLLVDDGMASAGHGISRGSSRDGRGGGWIKFIRPPGGDLDVLVLFAATLDQVQVNNDEARKHFKLMVRALKYFLKDIEDE